MAPCGIDFYIFASEKNILEQCRIVCEEQKLLGK